jgi:cytochrome c
MAIMVSVWSRRADSVKVCPVPETVEALPVEGNRPWESTTMRLLIFCLVTIGCVLLSASASADGDPVRGERVFNRCKSCHEVERERNRNGPHLIGLFGRASGAVEGFRYSPAMQDAEIVWDEETLDRFLADPRGYMRGNRMSFAGLRQDQDRQDVIAYLKQATVTD